MGWFDRILQAAKKQRLGRRAWTRPSGLQVRQCRGIRRVKKALEIGEAVYLSSLLGSRWLGIAYWGCFGSPGGRGGGRGAAGAWAVPAPSLLPISGGSLLAMGANTSPGLHWALHCQLSPPLDCSVMQSNQIRMVILPFTTSHRDSTFTSGILLPVYACK